MKQPRDCPDLQFKLIGAIKMGEYESAQPALYKEFHNVDTPWVKGVEWTQLTSAQHYTEYIKDYMKRLPEIEGFVMERCTKQVNRRKDSFELRFPDDATESDVSLGMIKLKCTSTCEIRTYKRCDEDGNEKGNILENG